jgi:hypothetical protein
MFPGATTFISTELVSNLEPVLLIRDPVAVLCSVSPNLLVRSRIGSGSRKQHSRDSEYDIPAHD